MEAQTTVGAGLDLSMISGRKPMWAREEEPHTPTQVTPILVHLWGEHSRDWSMGRTPEGNIPRTGEWGALAMGIFQGLANGVHSRGECSRDWPMGCIWEGNVPGIGE